jgi:hypothetical protein
MFRLYEFEILQILNNISIVFFFYFQFYRIYLKFQYEIVKIVILKVIHPHLFMGRDHLTMVILTINFQINMKKILKIEKKTSKHVLLLID